jgi:hypothetical protein
MDDMEWELKVRNQAMKRGCASVQMDSLKKALSMLRVIMDTIVQILFRVLQIFICLFCLLLPTNGATEISNIMAELKFLFNELIILAVKSMKELANLLFNMIFTTGPLGSAMKTIFIWICKMVNLILWAWDETGIQKVLVYFVGHA